MRTLYLQKSPSFYGPDSLAGKRLFDQLRSGSEETMLGYAVLSGDGATTFRNSELHDDFLSEDLLTNLNPNLIYLEGGLFMGGSENACWRVPQVIAKRLVSKGAVMIVADAGFNNLNAYRASYSDAVHFLRTTVAYGTNHEEDASGWPVQCIDPVSNWDGDYNIVCKPSKMAVDEWLRPVYDGVDEILVAGAVKLSYFQGLLASGNSDTTRLIHQDVWVDDEHWSPFAGVARVGYGYVALIAGEVSHDVYTQHSPGNLVWLENVGRFLLKEATVTRERYTSHLRSPYSLFISYSRKDDTVVGRLVHDLQAAGIAVWIDEGRLTPGTPDWEREIRQAIGAAQGVIYVASEDAVASQYVRDEITIAHDRGIPVYPIWVRGERWSDCVPLGWGRTQYVDGRGDEYESAVQALIASLTRATGD